MMRRWLLIGLLGIATGCPNPHPSLSVKNFGYVGSGNVENAIVSTSPFTNLASVDNCTSFDCASRAAVAHAHGVKLVVSIGPVLVSGVGTPHQHLYPDYVARWMNFRTTTGLDGFLGDVLMFYVVDEPTIGGLSAADLATMTNLIKATYPSIPTAMVENPAGLNALVVPASMDWIGVDNYAVRDPNTDPTWLANYAKLLTKRSRPDQRVLMVMDAWWTQDGHGAHGITPDEMGAVADNYFAFAKAHKEIITIAAFLWPNPFGSPTITSIQRPDWVVHHRAIGKAITGK